jgi:hypothetical protein
MTPPLAKAILVRLTEIKGSGKDPTPTFQPEKNGAFEVQFNPTSLRITRQNNIDHGATTTKSVKRQNPSVQPATLTFDLEFDSAEDAEPPPAGSQASGTPTSSGPHAVDVRTKTLIIRQFAEPSNDKPTSPPPPVRFIWGTFVFTGLVTQITEDLDYFSSDGRPLRAKVSVTITEKNPEWEAKLTGAAARGQPAATRNGSGEGSGPGSAPATNPDTAALAQAGESLQQLLSRLNADPATWRAAMAGLSSPLGLAAGAQVQLAAGVSASAGLGASAGFALGANASASATLGAALGISAAAGASISAGAGLNAGAGFSAGAGASASADFTAGGGVAVNAAAAAGFSLAEGGGVAASYAVVAGAAATASAAAARTAFSVPDVAAKVDASVQLGTASVGSLAASARVDLDPRTQGYGMGIPLRTRAQATTVVSTTVAGSGIVTARSSPDEVSSTADASVPPWVQLPSSASARTTADVRQRQRDTGDSTLRWGPGR